ncbi:hypothetical protein [Lactococcus garvieae]|uniref:hypothetical protein n=1 Tax=Lactococcus garvieae TaxID=1363 RepID=UPI0021F8DC8F|nr:hypothetical protein [Lactococcus garvieae]UYT12321.1 hypothetical protein OF800_10105 [Lactococcus garvieae]
MKSGKILILIVIFFCSICTLCCVSADTGSGSAKVQYNPSPENIPKLKEIPKELENTPTQYTRVPLSKVNEGRENSERLPSLNDTKNCFLLTLGICLFLILYLYKKWKKEDGEK